MPEIVALPTRSNALTYEVATVEEVAELLAEAGVGHGVAIDEPQDTAGKARARARTMVKMLAALPDPIQARTHILEDGDAYVPVLSAKPVKEPADAEPDEDDDDDDAA